MTQYGAFRTVFRIVINIENMAELLQHSENSVFASKYICVYTTVAPATHESRAAGATRYIIALIIVCAFSYTIYNCLQLFT